LVPPTREYGYDTRSGLQQAADLAGNDWSYTYAPTIGSDISYDVESGAVSLNASDAYGFGESGGTEYRDAQSLSDEHGAMSSAFGHALASVTSPLGETTTYHRNTAGRLDLITYPDNGTRSITYDTRGLPVTTVLPQGTTVSRAFDSAFRETQRTTSTGETRSMTYGVMDRVETMTDATGTTTYHYDAAGRFVGMTYPHGGSVMYDRDVLSRVTDVRVKTSASATELVTHYVYDANGNLSALTDPNGGVTSYVYDAVDRLTSRTLPNDVTTTYTYDARDRVLSVVHTGLMSNVLASTTYVRSPSGEPTRVTREDGSYVVLTYDAALRLDTETYYDVNDAVLDAIDYGYDLDGNRTSKVSLNGGSESYAYAAGFKLSSVTRGSETDVFTYDGGGRTTGIDRGGVARGLEWNVDDKLTRVVDDGVEVASYAYDGAGRRVGSVIGGVSKRYLVAPNVGDGYETPQAITDASGALIAAYVFAGEHPIAKINGSGVIEYYLQDSMGSVIGGVNAAGSLSASVKYDSFGEVVSATGSAAASSAVGGNFRLHGMWLDEVSGLYHVRARTYDAARGRFLSRDPVKGVMALPESMNPYVFCNSNAWRWRDPSGRFSIAEAVAVVAALYILTSTALPGYQTMKRRIVGQRSSDRGFLEEEWSPEGVARALRNSVLGNQFLLDLQNAPTFNLYSFDSVQATYSDGRMSPLGGVLGYNCDGSRCDGQGIKIRADVPNWKAAAILFHEVMHKNFATEDGEVFRLSETEIRLRHEYFALQMGWPEVLPGSRVDGLPSLEALQEQVADRADLYSPQSARITGLTFLGQANQDTQRWVFNDGD